MRYLAVTCFVFGVVVVVFGFAFSSPMTNLLLGAIALFALGGGIAMLWVGELLRTRFKQ
jgi:hypothetical protein